MAVVDGQNNAAAFRWRWVDAARYAVALAVTALVLTVIAYAISFLLRSRGDLFLQLDKGFVAVYPATRTSKLTFSLDLEVANPSGRVDIYYEDIHVYLYGRANNASEPRFFMAINVGAISVKPQSSIFIFRYAYPHFRSPDLKPYADLFNSSGNNGIIPDGVVIMNGTLTIGLNSWHNRTGTAAEAYYCWPVPIGGVSSYNTEGGGAQCTNYPPTPEVDIHESPKYILL